MNINNILLSTLLFVNSFLLVGCAPDSYVTLLKNPDGSVGKVIVKGMQGETEITEENYAANTDGSSKTAYLVSKAKLAEDFNAALNAQPLLPLNFLLYFEAGGTNLTPESQALIPKITQAISTRPGVDISITGHTDTSGAAALNAELALKRATEISKLFDVAKLNIKEMTITSHGEKNLLIKTPDETPEARNRRVEISVR